MNLYLVLALALGAVSAAPVERRLASVVAESRMPSDRSTLASRGWPLAVGRSPKVFFAASGERRTANEIPLTGGASPRAPACC